MSVATVLDQYLRAQGLPITGVAIGDEADRSTWTVRPVDLQAQAQPHIDACVLPTAEQLADADADRQLNKAIRALARETYLLVPNYAGKPTFEEFFTRVKERFKALMA